MTRAEDVDAAIERAQDPHAMYASQNLEADNELLAEEVVRLRAEMAEMRAEHYREMNEAGKDMRDLESDLRRAEQRLEDWDVPR